MNFAVWVKRIALGLGLGLVVLFGLVAACSPARLLMTTADPAGAGPVASPPLLADASTLPGWEAGRAQLLDAFATHIYGAEPPMTEVRLIERTLIDETAYGGAGRLELVRVAVGAGDDAPELTLALVLPNQVEGPVPAILIPNECGLSGQLARPDLPAPTSFQLSYCTADGPLADLIGGFFGEYALSPPIAQILARGYALVAWHESDLAPDSSALHGAALERLGLDPGAPNRPGSVSLWAWTMSRVADHLATDARFDPNGLMLMGHSRRGKAVLLAAARDERFAVTLAHQAGTAGGSLHADGVGEPVAAITESYPHWFAPRYAAYADNEADLPVDQHQLIALIAPRAVLLGNAWRDVWSDPAGAWRAAVGASPAWALYGEPGLEQAALGQFDPEGHVAVHIRPGLHGIHGADWEAFLAFADAHRP